MDIDTSRAAIGAALRTLDHARTKVTDLVPGDEIWLSNHIPVERRCVNDSGYQLHIVAVSEPIDLDWHLVTDQRSFTCAREFAVYKVGAQRT